MRPASIESVSLLFPLTEKFFVIWFPKFLEHLFFRTDGNSLFFVKV